MSRSGIDPSNKDDCSKAPSVESSRNPEKSQIGDDLSSAAAECVENATMKASEVFGEEELNFPDSRQGSVTSNTMEMSLSEIKGAEGIAYSDDISQISDDGMSVSSSASGFVPFSPVRPMSSMAYNYLPSGALSFKCDNPVHAPEKSLAVSPTFSSSLSPSRENENIRVDQSSPTRIMGENCTPSSSPLMSTSECNSKSPSLSTDRVSSSDVVERTLDGNTDIPLNVMSRLDCGTFKINKQINEEHVERGLSCKDAGVDSLPTNSPEDSLSPIHPAKRAVGSDPPYSSVDRAANISSSSSMSSLCATPVWTSTFKELPGKLSEPQLSCHRSCTVQGCKQCRSKSDASNHPPPRPSTLKKEVQSFDLNARQSLDDGRRLRTLTAEMRPRQYGDMSSRHAPTSASSSEDEGLVASALLDTIRQLKKEKESLANQYEREEEYLTNDLTKKLNRLREEKEQLERTLEKQQESVVNKLLNKISKLERDIKMKQEALDAMRRERVDLENTLEQEQEALVNKLWKRMKKLEMEKHSLQECLRRRDAQQSEQFERASMTSGSSTQSSLLLPCNYRQAATQTTSDGSTDEVHVLRKQVIFLRTEITALRKQVEKCQSEEKCRDTLNEDDSTTTDNNVRLKRKLNSSNSCKTSILKENMAIEGKFEAEKQYFIGDESAACTPPNISLVSAAPDRKNAVASNTSSDMDACVTSAINNGDIDEGHDVDAVDNTSKNSSAEGNVCSGEAANAH